MAATPTAQPYWKQAMPSAYTPEAFKSLSPEEQAREKKKAGCCGTCCCICLIIIVILLVGGGITATCTQEELCPYLTVQPGSTLTTVDARSFNSDLTDIKVKVTRGSITFADQSLTEASSVASVENSGYDTKDLELLEKNDFETVDGQWVSKYEKSGTGVNDCFYCRQSFVTVTPGTAVENVKIDAFSGPITLGALDITGELLVDNDFGDIESPKDLKADGKVMLTTNTGHLHVEGNVETAGMLKVFGGAGLTGSLEHLLEGNLKGGNVTIQGNSNSVTTISGAVTSDERILISSFIAQATVNDAEGASITAGTTLKITGAGFINLAQTVTGADVIVDVMATADDTIDKLGFTESLMIDNDGNGKAVIGLDCPAGVQANVTVKSKYSGGETRHTTFSWTANDVDLWAAVDKANRTSGNYEDYFLACDTTATTTKTVTVDLLTSFQGEVTVTEN